MPVIRMDRSGCHATECSWSAMAARRMVMTSPAPTTSPMRLMRWRLRSQSCHWFVQREDALYLQELAELVDEGLVRSHLSETIAAGDVREGYARIESGRTVGKLAIDVSGTREASIVVGSDLEVSS